MNLQDTARKILSQLADIAHRISPGDFSRPSEVLGGASIGQHIRHIVEFFTIFEEGCKSGVVNYDKRRRNVLVETDKNLALNSLSQIRAFVTTLSGDAPLRLAVSYSPGQAEYHEVHTSLMRELVYNIEHAVHHMAMIRIGLKEVAAYVQSDDDLGIAASTVRYSRATAAREIQ